MNRKTYLLSKIAEEASEVAQMAAKTQQFGLHERYTMNHDTNVERLKQELTDLLTVVGMLQTETRFDFGVHVSQMAPAKVDKVEHYYSLALRNEDLGPVDSEGALEQEKRHLIRWAADYITRWEIGVGLSCRPSKMVKIGRLLDNDDEFRASVDLRHSGGCVTQITRAEWLKARRELGFKQRVTD